LVASIAPNSMARASPGLGEVDAGTDQVRDVGIDMKTELDVLVACELPLTEDVPEPSGIAPRTLATTVEKRFQDSFSALSCFRPAAVKA